VEVNTNVPVVGSAMVIPVPPDKLIAPDAPEIDVTPPAPPDVKLVANTLPVTDRLPPTCIEEPIPQFPVTVRLFVNVVFPGNILTDILLLGCILFLYVIRNACRGIPHKLT
jgi:hypothetical protein